MIFSKKKPKSPEFDRAAALASKPVRTVEAELKPDDAGGGKLVVKLKNRKWGIFRLPEGATKTFELDEVGVFVWNSLDGKTTVEKLLRSVGTKYKLDLRQAEASTIAFLQTLMKKGLVGLTKDEND
ncbi:MAG: PqqD family protein [Tepidisphaeraceae bacterium]